MRTSAPKPAQSAGSSGTSSRSRQAPALLCGRPVPFPPPTISGCCVGSPIGTGFAVGVSVSFGDPSVAVGSGVVGADGVAVGRAVVFGRGVVCCWTGCCPVRLSEKPAVLSIGIQPTPGS